MSFSSGSDRSCRPAKANPAPTPAADMDWKSMKSVPGVKVPTDRELMWKDLWTADMGYVMKE